MVQVNGLEVEPIIGLEVHLQLRTRTKLWCGCAVEPGAPPNSRVCPVCLGLPGALPVLNRQAVEHAVRVGLGLNCQIARQTQWDRSRRYCPDRSRHFHVTQHERPLGAGGWIEFPLAERIARVRIRRAHLDEDAGKSWHDAAGRTTIDLNRAGIPLLGIVTEPDLNSADAARELAVQLQRLVRYLGVSDANMELGQLRCEPNVNVRICHDGQDCRTPIVAVKNLNSFRSLHAAVEHEIHRQVVEWQATGVVAAQGNRCSRGWDDTRSVTVPQRAQEEPDDGRRLPGPDLVPLTIDGAWLMDLRDQMPELPVCRAARFSHEFRVSPADAAALVDDRATADLLDHAAESGGDKPTLARHFLGFWAHHANTRGRSVGQLGISPGRLAELANLQAAGDISATAAAQVAVDMLTNHDAPRAIAQRRGLLQVSDAGQIAAWVEQVLAAETQAVCDALPGSRRRRAARGFLAGCVMKLSGGRADPRVVAALIERRLSPQAPR